MPDGLIRRARSQLLLVDVQEKLAPAMLQLDAAVRQMAKLIQAARALGIPLTVAEQHPAGLGRTIPELRALADDALIFEKTTFSCAAQTALREVIHAHAREGRDQLLVLGLETHVCVLQTAVDFLAQGLRPFVVLDATTARAERSIAIAQERLRAAGVSVVTAEMAFFEWIENAATPEFTTLRHLVR